MNTAANHTPDWLHRPVFIVGHPKSGTTLLTSLLDGHPQLMVFPEETHYCYYIDRPARAYFGSTSRTLREKKNRIDWTIKQAMTKTHMRLFASEETHHPTIGGFDYRSFDHEKFIHLLQDRLLSGKQTSRSIFDAFVLAFADTSDVYRNRDDAQIVRWIEKTPRHLFHVRELRRMYPEARFIHIVRDPRDTFASYSRRYKNTDAVAFSNYWIRGERAGMKHRAAFGEQVYRHIRYEDLLRNPEETLQSLKVFLGITADALPLVPTKHGIDWQGNSMWKEAHTRITTKPIGRFREYHDQDEIKRVERLVWTWLLLNGHTPEFQHSMAERGKDKLHAKLIDLRAEALLISSHLLRRVQMRLKQRPLDLPIRH